MDARRWLWGVVLVVAGCSAPSPSGEVVDANKSKEPVQAEYLPSDPQKQGEGIKGMMGFNRATPPTSVKKPDNPEELKPLKFRPITYFAKNCASCHGDDGSKFDAKSAELSEKELSAKVASEVRDKTKNKVTGRELGAVVMLTQAILHKAAYAAWVDGGTYETRPGSNLVVRGKGEGKKKNKTEWTVEGLKQGSEVFVTLPSPDGGKASSASLMYPRSQAHGPFGAGQ